MRYQIIKTTDHQTVDFAAGELKKYLRMMMPRCGEIAVLREGAAEAGLVTFRLGVMADFGLSTDEADNVGLDDILHIDTDAMGGIIAGSNPRSVLLAVYRYLRENGCRWLYPGVDGEFIPVAEVKPVSFHQMAGCRYRGQCNEGAESQQAMLETIDFTPKLGMNVYMLEFDNPRCYYDSYYNHKYNPNRAPEPVTDDMIMQWKRQCEAEIALRGLQFHDMGHGWTAEPFGIRSADGWVATDDVNAIPEDVRQYVAQLDGRRELFRGVALNTNFCMSNPDARRRVANYIADYADRARNVDYLHVWLADASNNHCECDACRAKTPSDWYMMLMGEIDEALTAAGLAARIVFICYTDTTWEPTTEHLRNSDRFSMLVAPISRSYVTSVPTDLSDVEVTPFVLNKNHRPSIGEYLVHAKNWRKFADCPTLVYEYHFWLHQAYDPGCMALARVIHGDIRGYHHHGHGGLIEDGSQRAYFPCGFLWYVYAQTLFDPTVEFDALVEDYFSHAVGEGWREVVAYLERLSAAFDFAWMEGERSADPERGKRYAPAHAADLRGIPAIVDGFAEKLSLSHPYRVQTVTAKLLLRHGEYCKGICEPLALLAEGKTAEALEAYTAFSNVFGRYEYELERYHDHFMAATALKRIFK